MSIMPISPTKPPKIIALVRRQLVAAADKKHQASLQRFFKEEVFAYGVPSKTVDDIARTSFGAIKHLSKTEIFALAEELLASKYNEEAKIAFFWVYKCKREFAEKDIVVFERWLKKYVTNWGTDDDLCTHPLGYLIAQFPALLPRVKKWTSSSNRWVRRASAVSLIPALRSGNAKYLAPAFIIADTLLTDTDDMVQKGYGWMLKEATKYFPEQIFAYVLHNKANMPRTALRYAIEKLPKKMKQEAMEK